MKYPTIICAATLFGFSLAHRSPSTAEEVAAQKTRQESAYHCAPQIAAQVAARKKAAQLHFNGIAQADGNLVGGDNFILDCTPLEAAKIRNHTCVLSPEVTQGPYYHVAGHPIRQNIAEDQLGLLFLMDVGVIDVSTCQPVKNILVDLWHANTTGHYAGHADPDPTLIWEGPAPSGVRKGLLTKFPRANDEETWLRGAWPTNENGVAQFTSIFPGYYTGRATHVHTKIHTKWSPNDNGTFTTDRLVHTGQLFVDDTLNDVIDKLSPYNSNPIRHKWGRTRNWEDSLQVYQDSHEGGFGATFEIEKLGGVISQGLIGYITIGVDLSLDLDRGPVEQRAGRAHATVREEL